MMLRVSKTKHTRVLVLECDAQLNRPPSPHVWTCEPRQLWSTPEELAMLANIYYEARRAL